MKNRNRLLFGSLITLFFLTIITIKMDCKTSENDIISLKMKKRIIEDHIKVLKSKESHLLSKNRIENIAMESFGMYSPSPEPLIVKINE